jgi:DeoR/GlpR family transcriptional regulator of sugar metabolism
MKASAKRLGKPERHRRIVAELGANSGMRISELASELRVSKETIRRDLDDLTAKGLLNRTYGGAIVRSMGVEPSFEERKRELQASRDAIARTASTLVSSGEVVMLGPGATTFHFARRAAVEHQRLMVITPSVSAATVLANNPGIRVVLAPGDYDPGEARVWGPETIAFFEKFRGDTFIFSASGLSPEGAYEISSSLVWIERTILSRVRRRILLVDRSKFDRPTLELVCPLAMIDVIVTDAKPPAALLEAIKAANIKLHVAS